MTKFNEITNESERRSKQNYVKESWTSWRETRLQTLTRITNYLFVLNTGALIASLTYVATKPTTSDIQLSIWLFSLGTLFSVLHATLDYYITENCFSAYQKDVEQLYSNQIDWEVFVDRNEKRATFDWLLHLLGWLGGLVFFAGLILGIQQIK